MIRVAERHGKPRPPRHVKPTVINLPPTAVPRDKKQRKVAQPWKQTPRGSRMLIVPGTRPTTTHHHHHRKEEGDQKKKDLIIDLTPASLPLSRVGRLVFLAQTNRDLT